MRRLEREGIDRLSGKQIKHIFILWKSSTSVMLFLVSAMQSLERQLRLTQDICRVSLCLKSSPSAPCRLFP